MAAYLLSHPPRRPQYRASRRAKPTGTIVLHTAENTPDLVGQDSGAENVAAFIQRRTDPGSYHLLGDRDSIIQLVPFGAEAYHDGTGSNPWSIGISLAITAHWFRTSNDEAKLWYMAQLATMARTAADWLEATHGITVPAKRLTKATQRDPGFCTHMDRETWEGTPGRRSDPWGDSDAMWSLFLDLYADTRVSTETSTPTPEADMKLLHPHDTPGDSGSIWLLIGDNVGKVSSPTALAEIQKLSNVPLERIGKTGWAVIKRVANADSAKVDVNAPSAKAVVDEFNRRLAK